MNLWKKHARQPIDPLPLALAFLRKGRASSDEQHNDNTVFQPPKLKRIKGPDAVKRMYRDRWQDPRADFGKHLRSTSSEREQVGDGYFLSQILFSVAFDSARNATFRSDERMSRIDCQTDFNSCSHIGVKESASSQ